MAIDAEREHLIGLAKAQRWLLVILLAHVLGAVTLQIVGRDSPGAMAIALFIIATWILMLASVASVTRKLGGWAWAIVVIVLMLIPLINLLTLIAVNQRAVRRLKEAGFTVGLMGVPKEQMG